MIHFISDIQVESMIAHALEDYPNECCGIIAGKDDQVEAIIKVRNDLKSPEEYSMNSAELKDVLEKLDVMGLDFLAVYHSHPTSEAHPSQTDISKSTFPEIDYMIISLTDKSKPAIKNFKIIDNEVVEEPYVVMG